MYCCYDQISKKQTTYISCMVVDIFILFLFKDSSSVIWWRERLRFSI